MPLDETPELWAALRRELPNSFRFCGSKGHALSVQDHLIQRYIPEIVSVKYNEKYVEPPKQLKWYPNQLAWDMTTPKNVVRKFPPFSAFQKFLVSETNVGNITRQEVVSMLPPLFMDIKPGMVVLDLCAAPGSKTSQLIEMLHGGEEARVRKVIKQIAREAGRELSPDGFEIDAEKDQAESEDDYSDEGRSTGLLIANDVEYKRAQMLIHQVKRLASANIIVTNHDATFFPSIRVKRAGNGQKGEYLKFDRILADVPCSGDGTVRKNPAIWKDWIPGNALGLHSTQLKILIRAIQMLKVGGRIVYSTCSMNPLENEAVVAAAIDRSGGIEKVNIVDCGNELPGLERRNGLKSWHVMDKSQHIWKSWDALDRARESGEPEGAERLTESMFPPREHEQIPLEHCMRVYPHLQDTGAFFICVLEKKGHTKTRPENEPKPTPGATATSTASTVPHGVEGNGIAAGDDDTASVDGGVPLDAATTTNGEAKGHPSTPSRTRDREEDEDDESGPPAKSRKIEENVNDEDTMIGDATEGGIQTPLSVDTEQTSSTMPQPIARLKGPRRPGNQPHEEAFKYLEPTHPELEEIFKFYGLSPRFPRDRFMVRNPEGEPAKSIYYTSTLARTILELNEGTGMKFVHCGVKMFVKQDAQGQDTCRWRIQSDGLPIVEPWVGEQRVIRLYKKPTLRKLLREMFPRISRDGSDALGEISQVAKDLSTGCAVLRVEPSDDPEGFKSVSSFRIFARIC